MSTTTKKLTDEQQATTAQYIPYVRHLAEKRKWSNLSTAELTQAGALGLSRAVKDHKPEKGTIMTYSRFSIVQAMRVAEWQALMVKPPLGVYYGAKKPDHKARKNVLMDGRSLGWVEARAEREGPDVEKLDLAIGTLTPRERFVVRGSFWEGRTYRSMAAELGVSIEHVRQIRLKALGKLKEKVV